MRKLLICGLMSLFCLGVCIIADFPQTSDAVIELMDFGYDKSRYQALEDAIEKYNNMKRSGHTFSLHVNHYVDSSWDWDDYVKDFNRRNRDKEIDLFMINSDYLSELVNAESIACMDDIISSGDFMYEYLTPLLPSMQYQGHYWGLLVETDVRIVYLNRNAAKQLGYSDKWLQQLPQQVLEGKFTLKDLFEFGNASALQGITSYGVVYRSIPGIFHYMIAKKFGAVSINTEGDIQYNRDRLIEMLSYFHDNAQHADTSLPSDTKRIAEVFAQKQAAVYMGACWSLGNIATLYGDEIVPQLIESYIPILLPAHDFSQIPSTMSNTMLITIAKNSKYKNELKEIIAEAYSDWDANAKHSSNTYHMPISISAVKKMATYGNLFLQNNLYMLDYTEFAPNTPNLKKLYTALYYAIRSAEKTDSDVEVLADMLIEDLKF